MVKPGYFLFELWSMESWFGSVQWKQRDSVIHSEGQKESNVSGMLCSFVTSFPFKTKCVRKSVPQVCTIPKGGLVNRGQVKQAKKPGKYNLSHRFAIFHMNFITADMTERFN